MTYIKLVILFLISGVAHAERLAKIMYYQAAADAPESAFVYQTKDEAQEVELKRSKFSDSFSLDADTKRLVFLPRELPADSEIPPGSPFVVIPEKWEKVILFAFKDPKNPIMPIQIRAFDASDNVFGPGELLFINQSEFLVGGLAGSKKINLKANSAKTIESPLSQRGVFNLMLDTFDPQTNQRRNLVRRRWLHVPQFRNVVFITKLPPPKMAKLFVAEIRKF